jgi:hypothetical protein
MDGDTQARGRFACSGARLLDGERTLEDRAVLIEVGVVSAVVPRGSLLDGLPPLAGSDVPCGAVPPGLSLCATARCHPAQ